MEQIESKLDELKEMLIEDGYNDSNIVLQTLENIRLEAINYTRCCEKLNGIKEHNLDIAFNGYCTKCFSREEK